MAAGRTWLDVPYQEKDEAKALGARWDPNAKRWYAPQAGMNGLQRWEALPDIGELLPGEDRGFGSGLFIDLVPSSCWFTNVRSCVDRRDWERLRRMVTKRADQLCEICRRGEAREEQRWLEVHERWSYDSNTNIQSLRRLICLCTDCHRTTHFGLAQIKGLSGQALAHLMTVTGCTQYQADEHVRQAFAVWNQRSHTAWTLDLSILTGAGVTIVPPPEATVRPQIAKNVLRTQR